MLEIVSKGFENAKNALTGKATLTQSNIEDAMRQIRISLLEADVETGVVRAFLKRVEKRAIGEVIQLSAKQESKKVQTSPGEHFIHICHNELIELMGPVDEAPIAFRRPYTCIMMVGLQGTGKTTSTAKMAKWLLACNRRPLLVAADIYRPAAIDQLKVLGEQLGVPVYSKDGVPPPQLCRDALYEAKRHKRDVVIFDTAGRLAIDDTLMTELEEIKKLTKPHQVLLVCDAMAGQDTVHTAAEFNRRLDLSGFIMTKLDGDARGGAALSIKEITGKPIKFLGQGEALDKLEVFRPEGLASRILGMGDVVGLMQDFEAVVDEKQAERDAKKMLKGQFTLQDFLSQLRMIKKMGSLGDIFEKMPMFGNAKPDKADLEQDTLVVFESIIQSMTMDERQDPAIINPSRTRRIAKGSGREPAKVKDLLSRFTQMKTMMSSLASNTGMLANMPGFKQLSKMQKMGGGGDFLAEASKSLQKLTKGNAAAGQPQMPAGMGLPGLPGTGGSTADIGALAGMGNGMPGMGDAGAMTPDLENMDQQQLQQMMQSYQQMRMGGASTPARTTVTTAQRSKTKNKRKQAKRARKKGRR